MEGYSIDAQKEFLVSYAKAKEFTEYKFYIDASPEIRAERRMEDEKNTAKVLDYNEVLSQIIERDRRDKERTLCPLVLVDDAVYINTDNLTIDQVVDKILQIVKN